MAHRIEAQMKSQKELLGAVSHELRTPLARLRVLVGSLAESEHGQKLAFNMEREILELDALVGELLAGARVDAGALQRRDLDVADILRVCVERSGLPETSRAGRAGCGARAGRCHPALAGGDGAARQRTQARWQADLDRRRERCRRGHAVSRGGRWCGLRPGRSCPGSSLPSCADAASRPTSSADLDSGSTW